MSLNFKAVCGIDSLCVFFIGTNPPRWHSCPGKQSAGVEGVKLLVKFQGLQSSALLLLTGRICIISVYKQ